jgi:REP element-mobilizing transposase RayT
MDRYLDTTRNGPMYLGQDAIARIVMDSLYKGEQLGHYELHAWVILSNHVHVLLTPRVDPSRLIASLKGTTAREANKLLGRSGQPFWQSECYDRWVRNQQEFRRIASYIETNPVKAGLATEPDAFRWSSAWMRPDESRRGGHE